MKQPIKPAAVITTALAILLIAVYQILPHPWNFVPVTAAAIFSGIYVNRKIAVLVPLAALFLADIVQGISWADVPFVYGAVALAALIGFWIGRGRSRWSVFIPRLAGGTIASSVLFFIITNFGVWAFQNMYPKDAAGLIQCYTMGIPFFGNTLAGDMVFSAAFVVSYELLARWATSLVSRWAASHTA